MSRPTPYLVQMLFGDAALEALVIDAPEQEPWRSLASARAASAHGDRATALRTVRALATAQGIESRYRALAWNIARRLGGRPPAEIEREVLGVIVEVGMQRGPDLLAAYADRTAYYYNYSGAGVIWMRSDSSLDSSVDQVLDAARAIVGLVDPWDQPRRPPPNSGEARLNILTPMGIRFGEGQMSDLSSDHLAGPLLKAATALLVRLTSLPRRQ